MTATEERPAKDSNAKGQRESVAGACLVLIPLAPVPGAGGALPHFRLGQPATTPPHSLRADRPSGARDRAAGDRRACARRQAGARASPAGDVQGRGKASSMCGRRGACPRHEREAPLLVKLSQDDNIHIIGINYKDQPDKARAFLARYGNPYAMNGADLKRPRPRSIGASYGVPETFIVGPRRPHRLQAHRHRSTPENIETVLKPQIEKAPAAGGLPGRDCRFNLNFLCNLPPITLGRRNCTRGHTFFAPRKTKPQGATICVASVTPCSLRFLASRPSAQAASHLIATAQGDEAALLDINSATAAA